MRSRPIDPRFVRMAAAAASALALLASTSCSVGEDQPLQNPGPEVRGGAVGPDARVDADVGLKQVQLEYPLDGRYDEGEDARLFFAVTNTGPDPASLVAIEGPDFGEARVETADGGGLPLTVDPDDNLYVGAEGPPDVTLLDLGTSLRSSESIPVTFRFADAGEVTVDVVVAAEGQTPSPPFDFPDDGADQDPSGG